MLVANGDAVWITGRVQHRAVPRQKFEADTDRAVDCRRKPDVVVVLHIVIGVIDDLKLAAHEAAVFDRDVVGFVELVVPLPHRPMT